MKRPLAFLSSPVWPPAWLTVPFALFYGVLELALWSLQLGSNASAKFIFTETETSTIRTAILLVGAAIYAAYRLLRFHPALNLPYAGWLRLSPWTSPQPLPLGPIHLVWQDALVLGILTALACWAKANWALPLAAFGVVYLLGLNVVLAMTRQWISCIILAFLWPALLLPTFEGYPILLVSGAIVAATWHGQRKALRAFPKGFPEILEIGSPGRSIWTYDFKLGGGTQNPRRIAGWPIAAIAPKLDETSVNTLAAFWISALAGWWLFCIGLRAEFEPSAALIILFAVVAALFRLGMYCAAAAAPFNLAGRMSSGRWLLPGYDKVCLTPLAAIVLSIVGASIIRHSGTWFSVTQPLVVAAVLFVLLAGGPTYRKWMLTGFHRYSMFLKVGSKQDFLRQI